MNSTYRTGPCSYYSTESESFFFTACMIYWHFRFLFKSILNLFCVKVWTCISLLRPGQPAGMDASGGGKRCDAAHHAEGNTNGGAAGRHLPRHEKLHQGRECCCRPTSTLETSPRAECWCRPTQIWPLHQRCVYSYRTLRCCFNNSMNVLALNRPPSVPVCPGGVCERLQSGPVSERRTSVHPVSAGSAAQRRRQPGQKGDKGVRGETIRSQGRQPGQRGDSQARGSDNAQIADEEPRWAQNKKT